MSLGIPKGEAILRLVIGLFILVGGVQWLLCWTGLIQTTINLWPFALITFGTLIAAGGIYRLKH